MYHTRPATKNKQKKKRKSKWDGTLAGDTFAALHRYIDVYGCGHTWQGHPVWNITKAVKAAYKLNRFDKVASRAYHSGRMTPAKMQEAIERDNQYFTCNKAAASGRSLVYLDLDDHHQHQDDKAALTAAVLKELPSEYFFYNSGRLWLKGEWKDETFTAWETAYVAFLDALRRWKNTKGYKTDVDTDKGITTLGRLPLKDWNYTKLETFKATKHVTASMLKEWTTKLSAGVISVPTPTIFRMSPRPVNECRSLSGVPFTAEDIDDIPAMFRHHKSTAFLCMAQANKYKVKGQKLYGVDVATALVVLDLCFRHRNDNDAMPQTRAKAVWKWLNDNGHVAEANNGDTRSWCDKKWAAIRNLLADCNVLNCVDSTYYFYADGGKKGKAMQFHVREEFVLSHSGEGEASIQDVKIAYSPASWRPILVSVPEQRPDAWATPYWERVLDETLYQAA